MPYFVADVPKEIETDCLGPDCTSGCRDFLEIEAYPRSESPISAIVFHKDAETGWLRDVSVEVGAMNAYVCGGPASEATVAERLDVSAPIVGFEYTQTASLL